MVTHNIGRTTVGISLGRGSNAGPDGLSDAYLLVVEDERSNTRFLEIKMTGEQLAGMLTGLYQSKVPAEYRALDVVGMKAENKAVNVYTNVAPHTSPHWREQADAAFEAQYPELYADGWRLGYYGWVNNSHMFVGKNADGVNGYSASISRHVPYVEATQEAS